MANKKKTRQKKDPPKWLGLLLNDFKATPLFYVWTSFLLILMLGAGIGVYLDRVHEAANVNDSVPWGLGIIVYVSSIGLAAGAFTLAGLVYIFRRDEFAPLVRVAILIGFIGYTSGALSLLLDLGRPDRFWHMIIYHNTRSVLTLVAWCLMLYTAVLAIEMLSIVFEGNFVPRWQFMNRLAEILHRAMPVVVAVGVLLSLFSQSAPGAVFSVVKASPVWFKPNTPLIFITTAIFAGLAFTLMIVVLTERVTKKFFINRETLIGVARIAALVAITGLFIRLWDVAATTYYSPLTFLEEQVALLHTQTPYTLALVIGEIILGSIVPIVILLNPNLNRRRRNLILAGLLAALGLFLNRWDTTLSGLVTFVTYSPSNPEIVLAPYFPALAEWLIAFGVVGYASLVYTLAVRFLPIFASCEETETLEHPPEPAPATA